MLSQVLVNGHMEAGASSQNINVSEYSYVALSFECNFLSQTTKSLWIMVSLDGSSYIPYRLMTLGQGVHYEYLENLVCHSINIKAIDDFSNLRTVIAAK